MGGTLIAGIGGALTTLVTDPLTVLYNLYAVALVIVGVGFVIFIHELGHFLVAKWAGVKVEMFSIGFGPTLISWRKGLGVRFGSTAKEYARRLAAADAPDGSAGDSALPLPGETEYSIRALPLGGFVLMLGEDPSGDEAKTSDPRAFQNKPVGARMAILSAGVIMNLLFGISCATWAYVRGKTEVPAVVGAVSAGQPAYEGGILPGDEIVSIDGRPDVTFLELMQSVRTSAAGQKLALEIKRRGQVEPVRLEIEPKRAPKAGGPTLGVSPAPSLELRPKTPEGLVANETESDRVVAAGPPGAAPTPVSDPWELDAVLSKYRDRPLTIVADRGPAGRPSKAPGKRVEAVVPPRPFVDFGMRMTPGPIVAIRPDSPAARAGFRTGDRIASVDGKGDFDPMRLPDLASANAGKALAFEVTRGPDTTVRIEAVPTDAPVWTEPTGGNEPLEVPGLGMALAVEPTVAAVAPGSPADKAGIRPGDVVKAVRMAEPKEEGAPAGAAPSWSRPLKLDDATAAWPAVFDAIQVVPGPFQLDLGKGAPAVITPAPVPDWFSTMRGLNFEGLSRVLPPQPLASALRKGLRDTKEMSLSIFALIRNMIQGRSGLDDAGGVLKIGEIGFKTAKFGGFETFLGFLGLLSVNLAVMNILPIPPLDGGQILFLMAEKVRGRPLPESAVAYPRMVGLILLLVLIVLFFFKDLISYF